MGLIVKPLASKHHAEIQRITDRAAARYADVAAMEAALRAEPTRQELAELSFAWAHLVMSLGGWGWWSVSPDGKLNPALVSWNKAWFVVPIDRVLSARPALGELLEQVRRLPQGSAGALVEVVGEAS